MTFSLVGAKRDVGWVGVNADAENAEETWRGKTQEHRQECLCHREHREENR